jgi:hypothetical protein
MVLIRNTWLIVALTLPMANLMSLIKMPVPSRSEPCVESWFIVELPGEISHPLPLVFFNTPYEMGQYFFFQIARPVSSLGELAPISFR